MLGMTQNNGHAWSDDGRIKKEADKKETAKPRGDGASSRERKLSGGRGRVEVAADEGVWRRPRKGQCGGGGGRGRGEGRVEEAVEEGVEEEDMKEEVWRWRWRRKGACGGGRQRKRNETKEITYGPKYKGHMIGDLNLFF